MRNIVIFMLLIALVTSFVIAEPQGPSITFNESETATPNAATSISTVGGSFTTLVLNGTTQTIRWKAYVGNVSGLLTLDDAEGSSIYDWDLAIITGEVYASRNSSVDFSSMSCAGRPLIGSEDAALNGNSNREDSINKTFNLSVHTTFLVGIQNITASSCPAIATYVNNAAQTSSELADFQEILLTDGDSLVYSTILEQDATGFDSSTYDFQMIVAESELSGPSTYYFWAELG